jgi:hypothetical protein
MTVKAIVLTKESIYEEIKRLRKYIEDHKKANPDYLENKNSVAYGQINYAQTVESHYLGMLCNFDYKVSEIEIVKEPKLKG